MARSLPRQPTTITGGKLPSWVHAKRPLPKHVREALNQEVHIPLRDSPDKIRGPREVDISYSMTPDPGCERDERVTAAIRKFDPQMVPLWGRYTFILDGSSGSKELVTFGRHVIARYISTPKTPIEPFKVILSPSHVGPVPNKIELIWDGRIFRDYDKRGHELPGPYLPWNWRVYHFARDAWNFKQNRSVEQLKKDLITTPQEMLKLAAQKRRAEQMELNDHIRKEASKILANVSEVEMKEYALYGHLKQRKKRIQVDKGKAGVDMGRVLDSATSTGGIIVLAN